jgi:ATP-dependent RNA helicase RhlE
MPGMIPANYHEKGISMSFTKFNFHPRIQGGIQAMGYTTPTPIQQKSIPVILQGRDVMGLAQTGTGKTAAFVLPIMQHLIDSPRRGTRALIVAPTRELAEQIHESIEELGRKTTLRSVAVYGGVNKNPQISKLREGAEIVVACPGRLLDLMDQGAADLSGIEILVLDEADRMFDMGFLPDIRKITKRTPEKRQTLLFSATMPSDIRLLAREVLRDPVILRVGDDAPASTVSHALYPVEQHLKTALLMKLLRETQTESVLIFTRTKHRTTRVAMQMKTAGFPVASLQGDLSQSRRQDALSGFRNGRYQILVATDIAARGIDVTRISHVINYDMPDTVDAYTHRIGRTGRAEQEGDAFSFVTPEERDLVGNIEHVLGERIERRTLEGFDYALPAPAGSGGGRRSSVSHTRRELPAEFLSAVPAKKPSSHHFSPRASGRRGR